MKQGFPKKVFNFFDKFEDKIRGHLSQYPITYAFVGGITIVLFWRGVWHTGDLLEAKGGILGVLFSGPGSLVLSILILLAIGLFVSVFVGDMIIMSGLKKEKKVVDKTEQEIKSEELRMEEIEEAIVRIEEKIGDIENEVNTHHADKKSSIDY